MLISGILDMIPGKKSFIGYKPFKVTVYSQTSQHAEGIPMITKPRNTFRQAIYHEMGRGVGRIVDF